MVVGFGYSVRVTVEFDFAAVDENSTIAIFADIFHGMGDEDDGLILIFETSEIFVAFLLEGSVTNGKNFVEE